MPHNKKKENILVVDDAPDTLELLKRNLTSQDYTVYTSSGVSSAIKILDSHRSQNAGDQRA
jgi:DNA-binding NtrC family response regulator